MMQVIMNMFVKLYRGWLLRTFETDALMAALRVLERSSADVLHKHDGKMLIAAELVRRGVPFWEARY